MHIGLYMEVCDVGRVWALHFVGKGKSFLGSALKYVWDFVAQLMFFKTKVGLVFL